MLADGHGRPQHSIRNALRQAQDLTLVTIEERRRTAWMNDLNKISIVSRAWSIWLRLSTGAKFYTPRLKEFTSGSG